MSKQKRESQALKTKDAKEAARLQERAEKDLKAGSAHSSHSKVLKSSTREGVWKPAIQHTSNKGRWGAVSKEVLGRGEGAIGAGGSGGSGGSGGHDESGSRDSSHAVNKASENDAAAKKAIENSDDAAMKTTTKSSDGEAVKKAIKSSDDEAVKKVEEAVKKALGVALRYGPRAKPDQQMCAVFDIEAENTSAEDLSEAILESLSQRLDADLKAADLKAAEGGRDAQQVVCV